MRFRLPSWRQAWPAAAATAVLGAAGGFAIARAGLDGLREAFDTDARIAHRLLSQRAAEHDAMLATLALLQPGAAAAEAAPEQRLPALYPQVMRVLRRDRDAAWPDPALRDAEAESQRLRRATLASADLAAGRFILVMAGEPASYALQFDLAAIVPATDWPYPKDTQGSPVRLVLRLDGQAFVIQPGAPAEDGGAARFAFEKHLAAPSQPFDLVATRRVGWSELPWAAMAGWVVLVGALSAVALASQRQRAARRRAEELLRLGQVGRLNALGELAAGMAHELNQPLAALMAGTQAARRLLDDEPPDTEAARAAMAQAVAQARRAADVLARLRRTVERPDLAAQARAVPLADCVRGVVELLQPEFVQRGVTVGFDAAAPAMQVLADPVALEQIVHNLLMNALQALDAVPSGERRVALAVQAAGSQVALTVRDSGPGIAPDALARLFEPFFSTKPGGLGLGLSLCETLAQAMGGSLRAGNAPPRGAEFVLSLPVAAT